jgi:hypothetical protein
MQNLSLDIWNHCQPRGVDGSLGVEAQEEGHHALLMLPILGEEGGGC